ncbi:hypothetical protein RFM68_11770 [Mesorhizobium sp. MSK_1335]|uniref:Uncharacterized protein n=1 Tax=Mesorhizobium montanum TaxID=3072323 RepID=A0ABU4ZLG5_9HYPH|nr:hypothetical protein [Mesorhizobium sp. MSK_1335]MDX8525189.1 hypothetical protein [Mesorhizobium sp. MSK_1335]
MKTLNRPEPGSIERGRISGRDIRDIVFASAFFDMSNRVAAAVDMCQTSNTGHGPKGHAGSTIGPATASR